MSVRVPLPTLAQVLLSNLQGHSFVASSYLKVMIETDRASPTAFSSRPSSLAASVATCVLEPLGVIRYGGNLGEVEDRQKFVFAFLKQVLRKLIKANNHQVV